MTYACRWITAAVLALSVVSFGASVWATTASPTANFFLAPTRVWELGLGALLAMGAFPATRNRAVVEAIAAAGFAMIVASIVLLTGETPFPGLAALPTCLGAVAIIWAGAQQSTLVGRLLSSPVPVFFGLISY
jgi:peptidoglycan/LPS O-acetylase OafA/YrhL